jgi:hypothetical protein
MPSTPLPPTRKPKPNAEVARSQGPSARPTTTTPTDRAGYEAQRDAVRPKPQGGGLFGWLFGGRGAGGSGGADIQSPELRAAIADANSNPDGILRARQLIEEMGDQLPPQERAEAYRQLAAAPSYRSQRDNAKDPDSTCNFTSQAMAFEALGINYRENKRGKQAEEQLYDRFYAKGMGSRTNEADRMKLARDQGLDARQLDTPAFGGAGDAKQWFETKVLPQLQAGASATMGIQSGAFRHVVRVQWIDASGILTDDPWGAPAGNETGDFGYTKLNTPGGDGQKRLGQDQQGVGNDRVIPWATVAKIMSNRYVQLYNASAAKVAGKRPA